MYVVEDGRLRAYGRGRRRERCFLRRGDFFGERSLLRGRSATVEAVSTASCSARPTFQRLLAEHRQFREQIEERMAQYEYRRLARVPLDFAEEILPADVGAPDGRRPSRSTRRRPRPRSFPSGDALFGAAAAADPPLPARLAGGRDGLRRRVRWRWSAATSAATVSLRAHPRGRPHGASTARAWCGIARGAEALGLGRARVKASKSTPRRAAAAGDRALGGQPLGRPLRRRRPGTCGSPIPARGAPPRRRARSSRSEWSGYAALLASTPGARGRAGGSARTSRWLVRVLPPVPPQARASRSCSRSSPPGCRW